MEMLQRSITQQLSLHQDCVVIVAGDFNHANLKSVLPKFFKNGNNLTRENNIHDQVHTNIPEAL